MSKMELVGPNQAINRVIELTHVPSRLVPCLPQDYEEAIRGIVPERWWRTYRKSV